MTIGFGVGVQRLGSFGVSTLAALNALPAPLAGVKPTGFVYADPDPANNGVYTWSGTVWERKRGLGEQIATLTVTGGTANAIIASPQANIDLTEVVGALLIPTAANTGAVAINGKAVKDSEGNALPAGAFVAGKAYFLWNRPTEYRAVFNEFASVGDVVGLRAELDAIGADIDDLAANKAPIDSPGLLGTPTAPTPVGTDNTTKIATTAFVQAKFALVGSNGKRNLTVSTAAPTSADGVDGDVWYQK